MTEAQKVYKAYASCISDLCFGSMRKSLSLMSAFCVKTDSPAQVKDIVEKGNVAVFAHHSKKDCYYFVVGLKDEYYEVIEVIKTSGGYQTPIKPLTFTDIVRLWAYPEIKGLLNHK
jgi:hypothetical protein